MLALIAGAGRLPAALSDKLPEPPIVCALEQFLPDDLKVDYPFRLETLGSLLQQLQGRGVREICMVGSIRRPDIDPAAIDAATLLIVPQLQKALMAGDDGALRGVIGILEDAGFSVRAAHVIAPELLPPSGCLTQRVPNERERGDAQRAAEIVTALAVADVGQGCVIRAGQALAIESLFGTDWMLHSLLQRPDGQNGGLLFKGPKVNQDRRVDLPTIGLDTIHKVAAAGLGGVVIESGGVIMLDLSAVIELCDQLGLFLWVRDPSEK